MALENILAEIGDIIKEKRVRCGWYQSDLAKRASVMQSTISRLEEGRYNIKLADLIHILGALDMELAIVDREPPTA